MATLPTVVLLHATVLSPCMCGGRRRQSPSPLFKLFHQAGHCCPDGLPSPRLHASCAGTFFFGWVFLLSLTFSIQDAATDPYNGTFAIIESVFTARYGSPNGSIAFMIIFFVASNFSGGRGAASCDCFARAAWGIGKRPSTTLAHCTEAC